MRRQPLPGDLGQHFTIAEATDLGMSRNRSMANDLSIPFRGVRTRGEAVKLSDRVKALQTILPKGSAFSHETAAALWGLPLPHGVNGERPIHVTSPRGSNRVRRDGVTFHRAPRTVFVSNGIRLVSKDQTWCDLAPAFTLDDLVILGDAILGTRATDVSRLSTALADFPGNRGRRQARQALELIRPGSGSPMETRSRLAFARWGLPEPELNADIYNSSGWLARVDFLWRKQRVVGEYYGEVHGGQWRGDLNRTALIEDEDYRVVVMTKDDLGPRQADLRRRLQEMLH